MRHPDVSRGRSDHPTRWLLVPAFRLSSSPPFLIRISRHDFPPRFATHNPLPKFSWHGLLLPPLPPSLPPDPTAHAIPFHAQETSFFPSLFSYPSTTNHLGISFALGRENLHSYAERLEPLPPTSPFLFPLFPPSVRISLSRFFHEKEV